MRFARNGEYADPATMLADGDEVAMIPPVSGGAGESAARRPRADLGPDPRAPRRPVHRLHPRRSRRRAGHSRGRRGRRVPRSDAVDARHSRAGPGGGGRASCRPFRRSARVRGARTDGTRDARHDRRRVVERFDVERVAIVHRIGEVRLGEASMAVVAVVPASRRGVRGRPIRHRRDKGARADLEGGAFRRRPCLDRPPARTGPEDAA